VVTLFSVRRLIGSTVFLLFPHEGPFLVELHLARLRGKTRPAHHAGLWHVRLPADSTGSLYRGALPADDSSCGRHSPRRHGPALRRSWPSPVSRQTAVSLAAPKTVLYRTGSTASANAGVSPNAYRRSGCQHHVGHGHGRFDCDSKTV